MMKSLFRCDRRSMRVGVASESMIVDYRRGSIYELRSSPLTRFNLAYSDLILCRVDDSLTVGLRFVRLYMAGRFSTFRIYPLQGEWGEEEFLSSLSYINNEGCGVSAHRHMGLAAVSVPPDVGLHGIVKKIRKDLRKFFVVEVTADRHC